MELRVEQVGSADGVAVHHARAAHVGWVLLDDGGEVTLVDSGYPGDHDAVLASLDRIGRSPSDVAAVVLTHGHPDHLGNAEWLRTEHGAVVQAHEDEVPNATGRAVEQAGPLALAPRLWRSEVRTWLLDVVKLGVTKPQRVGEISPFADGDTLDVPGRPCAISTPGHTSGHAAFSLAGVLIAGDALMTEHGVSPVAGPALLPDFFQHDAALARTSLLRLRDVDAAVVVPGHGPAFHGSPAVAVDLALR